METKITEVLITKEIIESSNYWDNRNCAVCKALRLMGYDVESAGGDYVRLRDDKQYPFMGGTWKNLNLAFRARNDGEDYGDVKVLIQLPVLEASQHPAPKAPEVVERIVYVMVDSTVKELSGQLTNN